MSHIDPGALFLFLELTRPLAVRTIAFDIPTFTSSKTFRDGERDFVKRRIGNAETLKYLIHTHPGVAQPQGTTGYGC